MASPTRSATNASGSGDGMNKQLAQQRDDALLAAAKHKQNAVEITALYSSVRNHCFVSLQ